MPWIASTGIAFVDLVEVTAKRFVRSPAVSVSCVKACQIKSSVDKKAWRTGKENAEAAEAQRRRLVADVFGLWRFR